MIKDQIHNLYFQVLSIYKIQIWKPQRRGTCWRLALIETTYKKLEERKDGNTVNKKGPKAGLL